MTLDQLKQLVSEAAWFSRLGEPMEESVHVSMSSLAPWGNTEASNAEHNSIADQMTWLPSSLDEVDPVHGSMLEGKVESQGKRAECSKAVVEIYKTAAIALRNSHDHPKFLVGPHNFSEAARGAALYATRRATLEILLDETGFWCEVMEFYAEGRWPCGLLPNHKLVIL